MFTQSLPKLSPVRDAQWTNPADAVFSLIIDSPQFGVYESAQVSFRTVEQAAENVTDWDADDQDRDGVRLGYVPRNAAAVDAVELAAWAVA
jgi:hypothetical protein